MILSGYIVVLFRWFIYVLFSQSFRGLLLSTSREGIGPHGFMLGHLYSVNLSADVASQTLVFSNTVGKQLLPRMENKVP